MRLTQFIFSFPKLSLFLAFVTWKSFLLALAAGSPGPGYDTSTTIALPSDSKYPGVLVRWDAIYYTAIAKRGYRYEQDWAFSWGFTQLVALLAPYFGGNTSAHDGDAVAWAGMFISHVSHLLTVLVLHGLTMSLFRASERRAQLALVAASLHIVSPAGLFLSAPCAESLFAALQFVGYYLYVQGHGAGGEHLRGSALMILSGIAFGAAVLVRSNGLLSGIPFAIDAISAAWAFASGPGRQAHLRRLVTAGAAGACIIPGAVLPQAIAWRRYCGTDSLAAARPWCEKLVPSIFDFVQSHYWNNGLFRYWTLSNLPLFLIAAPTFYVTSRSVYWAVAESAAAMPPRPGAGAGAGGTQRGTGGGGREQAVLHRALQGMAATQGVFVLVIFLRSHVQIVTRLASGYPVWYWWLAHQFVGMPSSGRTPGPPPGPKLVTRWVVAYAIVQGGLFSSFLPPA